MRYIKTFENHNNYEDFTETEAFVKPNVSYCIQQNEVHYNPHTWTDEYLTIESLEDNNVISLYASDASITKTVSVSTDNGNTWAEYTSSTNGSGTILATLNTGEKLLVKGENEAYATSSYYNYFRSTGQFEVKGNIMSLIRGDSFANADELTVTHTFAYLFKGCTGLTSAENLILPAMILTQYCYGRMFQNCTSLTTAPQLPATTLAERCYGEMFGNCSNLTIAPKLPATILTNYCYSSMFSGCTSLTTAPELPATTLASNCYSGMFWNCANLVTAPVLPATTLASSCYSSMFYGCTNLITVPSQLPATTLEYFCYHGMFKNCTSLTTAPALLATTLANNCCEEMFYGCTNLTTAPELLATTLVTNCYKSMFYHCTNLNYIKAMFITTPNVSYTSGWVDSVASTGTFVKNSNAQWNVTGREGIPSGWTVQTAAA